MKSKRIKLQEKYIMIIIIVGFVCFGLLGIIVYKQVSRMMIAQNKEDAMGIAETAANDIDEELFLEVGPGQGEAFDEVYNTLANYKVNNLIKYIYAMKEDGDHLIFVVDTDDNEPAQYGEPYEYLKDMAPVFKGEVCCDEDVTSDQWGTYYSAYAPIKTKDGQVVGLVGCDIAVESINQMLSSLRKLVILLVTLFAGIAIMGYIRLSRRLMGRDLLTGISNYDSLLKYGQKLRDKNHLAKYSGILVNIKDFKFINQRVGSSAGDVILQEFAQRMHKNMRRGDFVASTGSDNFFVLVKQGTEEDFLQFLSNVEIVLKTKSGTMNIPISSRCGIYQIKEEDTMADVMNACTLAVNKAKEAGAGDYQYFEDSMFEQMMMEKELLGAYRTGILKREFVVYYQPKVNLDTNTLYGAEALVRWYRNGKIVPPNQFIPVLEKNNLITDLDFYVFDQVCSDIKKWISEGVDVVRISSNFSKLHLSNEQFAEDILRIVDKYEIDTKYIEIELTESSGYYDLGALTHFVSCMNEANVSISIDDFGTGYSSLSLLKDLNVNVIKMDKSFFRDIETGDTVNEKMVENVIRMVQDLNREVISEGIETDKQADFLRRIHSPIVQGYLYDKPLPRSDFEKRLLEPVYA